MRRNLNRSGRIAANSMVQVVGNFGASFISLFTFAAVTRALGPASFGDLAAATAYLGIPVLLGDLGLALSVLREISKSPGRSERIMGTSVVLRVGLAIAILAVALAVAVALPFTGSVKYAIAVGSIGALLNLADLSLMPILQAQLRMQWVVGVTMLSRLFTLALVVALTAGGFGFKAIVWAYVIGNAVNFLLDLAVVRRLVGLHLVFDRAASWRLLRGTVLLGVALALGTAFLYVDRVLLSLLGTAKDVGLYATAFKFVEIALIAASAIGTSIFPFVTRAMADGESARVRHLLQRSVDIMIALSVPAAVFALVEASTLVQLVGGSQFAGSAVALKLLSPVLVLLFVAIVFERALVAGHGDHRLLILNAGLLVANVVLSVALIPSYGFAGVATITSVTLGAWVIAACWSVRRRYEFTPNFRFTGLAALGGAAMAAILEFVPGPLVVTTPLALVAFGVIALVPPGSGHELAGRMLANATSPRPKLAGR
ncbi:MAG TPA: flippase [Gaiellaceae bacterium]|nr:flippase [Gaiellaceae bacterium]